MLTHPDADHHRGLLEVLDRYQVASVLVGVEETDSALNPQWRASLERESPMKLLVTAGYRVVLEPDLTLEVLNPPGSATRGFAADRNNNAVVLRLVYGRVSFLLAANIEAEAENHLVRSSQTLQSAVLKVPHHGSRTSTTPAFLKRVDPAVAVVSVGEANRFGHPHPEVVDRLGEAVGPEAVYRTDRDGTIEFVSDGERLWVRAER